MSRRVLPEVFKEISDRVVIDKSQVVAMDNESEGTGLKL